MTPSLMRFESNVHSPAQGPLSTLARAQKQHALRKTLQLQAVPLGCRSADGEMCLFQRFETLGKFFYVEARPRRRKASRPPSMIVVMASTIRGASIEPADRTKHRLPSESKCMTVSASPRTGTFGLCVAIMVCAPGDRAATAFTSVPTTKALYLLRSRTGSCASADQNIHPQPHRFF